MQCTATTKDQYKKKKSHRCERSIGHPGLHRYQVADNGFRLVIQEFNDTQAWYPQYTYESGMGDWA